MPEKSKAPNVFKSLITSIDKEILHRQTMGDELANQNVVNLEFNSAQEMYAAKPVLLHMISALLDLINEHRKELSKTTELARPSSEIDEENHTIHLDMGSPIDLEAFRKVIDVIKEQVFYVANDEMEHAFEGQEEKTWTRFYFEDEESMEGVANILYGLAQLHVADKYTEDSMITFNENLEKETPAAVFIESTIFDAIKQAEVGIRIGKPRDGEQPGQTR